MLLCSVSAFSLEWNYEDGVLTISGNGKMPDYRYGSCPWSDYSRDIETVIISDGITSIGKSAFDVFDKLTNVIIPNSVTTIGESAFSDCESLISITIPNSVTSIGNYAFSECYNLTSITIPAHLEDYFIKAGYGDKIIIR